MERGTFFIWLFIGIAPSVALLLLWRGIRRALRETPRRGKIALVTLAVLALWIAASTFFFSLAFEVAWGLAHTRPFPDGLFPEGWPIYGFLAAYSALGAALVWILRRIPANRRTGTN